MAGAGLCSRVDVLIVKVPIIELIRELIARTAHVGPAIRCVSRATVGRPHENGSRTEDRQRKDIVGWNLIVAPSTGSTGSLPDIDLFTRTHVVDDDAESIQAQIEGVSIDGNWHRFEIIQSS